MTDLHKTVLAAGGCGRLASALCGAALLAALGCERTERIPMTPAHPNWNVLLVTFDTTRADHLSCYGYKGIQTPAVDALAAAGLRYTRCYATAPLTFPSHASMMTGLYPFHHGVRNNGAAPLGDQFNTLAEGLAASGRRTGAIIAAPVLAAQFGLNQGFQTYNDTFDAPDGATGLHASERRAADTTQAAIDWLHESTAQPYFLWVHYFDPHEPYDAPADVAAPAGASAYDREIVYADQQLGRLLAAVDALDKSTGRETLVVFTADHGEALWDHGEPTHGIFTYNETLRVPLIVRFPKSSSRTGVVVSPVSVADIYASILGWLGLPRTGDVRAPNLPTTTSGHDADRAVYFETYVPYFMYGWSPLEGVVAGDLKFISAPQPELYDLRVDGAEKQNLAGERAADVQAMRDELEDIKAVELNIATADRQAVTYDAEMVRQLMALGYLSSSEPIAADAALRPDPKDRLRVHIQCNVVQTELGRGGDAKAAEVLGEVLDKEPANPRALFLLLELLSRETVRDEALAMTAPLLDGPLPPPLDVQLPLRYAAAATANGQLEDALQAYDLVLETAPDELVALNNGAWTAYVLKKNPEIALQRARKAAAMMPGNKQIQHTLGVILLWQGDPSSMKAARDVLAALVRDNPDHASAHYHLGVAHESLGSAKEAAAAYTRAIECAGETSPEWLPDARSRLEALQPD